MSKAKKPASGQHKTKRRHIALPADWVALADALAADERQLTNWYMMGLLVEAAKAKGIPTPVPPWEKQKSGTPS